VLLIGMGFLGGGIFNAIMGGIADSYLPEALDELQTVRIMEQVEERFPNYFLVAQNADGNPAAMAELGYRAADVSNILQYTGNALAYYREHGVFNGSTTGNALRALIDSGMPQEQELREQASGVLRPADNFGGRMAFLWVSPVALLVGFVFLLWFIRDKRRGGYKVERLEKRELTV